MGPASERSEPRAQEELPTRASTLAPRRRLVEVNFAPPPPLLDHNGEPMITDGPFAETKQ